MSVFVCLSVTEVHWRIIANLGFKLRSTFIIIIIIKDIYIAQIAEGH